ncbi:efflux RND transporter periplasmic adaptor subunit [Cupriavidus sp. 2TAF22]|uniref:efflux RND transporter periplasmic adaptor subunit n=1 Tax=unclassified Cupriavidus TaxID=2640874 RepID=UPI003F91FA00
MKQNLRTRRLARAAVLVALPLAALALMSGCRSEDVGKPARQTVTVSKPAAREVQDVDTYTGRFEATDAVEVRSRVSGYLEKIAFQDGAFVKKGDLLFVIDPRPFQAAVMEAEGALAKARSQLALSEQEFERANVLIGTNTIARSLFDQRKQAVQGARAEVTSAQGTLARARLELSFTRIAAPMSGRISRKQVSEGNLVRGGDSAATVLTSIVSQDPIDIYFDVDEQSYLRYVRATAAGGQGGGAGAGREVTISLPGDAQPTLAGKMNFVENRLDSSTGTLRQRARVPNPDLALSPGQFGRVHLASTTPHAALLVPDAAVATDATRRVLYLVKPDQTVEVRAVTLGKLFGNLREIASGLQASDNVIVEGFQRVRAGEAVTPRARAAESRLAQQGKPEATP